MRLDQINHLVVVMFENRSFNHILGSLDLDPTGPWAEVRGVRHANNTDVHHLADAPCWRSTKPVSGAEQPPDPRRTCCPQRTPTPEVCAGAHGKVAFRAQETQRGTRYLASFEVEATNQTAEVRSSRGLSGRSLGHEGDEG
jgi:phospholipase C